MPPSAAHEIRRRRLFHQDPSFTRCECSGVGPRLPFTPRPASFRRWASTFCGSSVPFMADIRAVTRFVTESSDCMESAGVLGRGRESRRLSVGRESELSRRPPGDAAHSSPGHRGRGRARRPRQYCLPNEPIGSICIRTDVLVTGRGTVASAHENFIAPNEAGSRDRSGNRGREASGWFHHPRNTLLRQTHTLLFAYRA